MNVLIVGARGAGKTTLIRRVLESLDRPVWGFETEKEGDQVHIYDAGAEHVPTEENLVGLCGETRGIPVKEGFDRDLRQKKKEIRSIFMMRGRSMCPQRRIWWACAEKPAGFR